MHPVPLFGEVSGKSAKLVLSYGPLKHQPAFIRQYCEPNLPIMPALI